jgi:hypothetical protein
MQMAMRVSNYGYGHILFTQIRVRYVAMQQTMNSACLHPFIIEVLAMSHHYLNQLFAPHSVAVFGATEREKSVGALVFQNLLSAGFKGALYPINPKYTEIQGQPAYPNLAALNKPVDLAVVTTPAATVPGIFANAVNTVSRV